MKLEDDIGIYKSSGLEDDLGIFQEQPEGRTIKGTIEDIGVSLGKGLVGVSESALGLTGLASDYISKILNLPPEMTEYPKDRMTTQESQQELYEKYSEPQKKAFEEVEKGKGFVERGKRMITHPSTIGHTAIESAPAMFAGGGVGGGLVKMGVAPLVSGAIGEGLVSAGQAAHQIREEMPEKELTAKQKGAVVASGALTSLISVIGGRMAKKLGIADPDTLYAKIASRWHGGANPDTVKRNILVRMSAGGLTEGFLEEMPQSVQEQFWLNAATGRPLTEGLGEAGAEGALVGFGMGAVHNIFSGKDTADQGEGGKEPTIDREKILTGLVNNDINIDDLNDLKKDMSPEDAAEIDAAIQDFEQGRPNAPEIKTEPIQEVETVKELFPKQTPEEQAQIEKDIMEQREGKTIERMNALASLWGTLSETEKKTAAKLIVPSEEETAIETERKTKEQKRDFTKTEEIRKVEQERKAKEQMRYGKEEKPQEPELKEAGRWEEPDAAEIREEVKAPSQKQEMVKGEEERLRIRDTEKDRLEAEQGKIVEPQKAEKRESEKPMGEVAEEVSSEKATQIADEFNKKHPGNNLKFDGIQDRSAINKPPLYQFTPQEGPLQGRTFSVENPDSIETVKGKLDALDDLSQMDTGTPKDDDSSDKEPRKGKKGSGKLAVNEFGEVGGRGEITTGTSVRYKRGKYNVEEIENGRAIISNTKGEKVVNLSELSVWSKRLPRQAPTEKRAIGKAWIDNQQRPIIDAYEFKRGRNKGNYRVTLPDGSKKIVERDGVKFEEQKPSKQIKSITKTLKDETGSSELANDIYRKAADLIQSGVDNFGRFRREMQKAFKNVWDKIKKHMHKLWEILKDQKGQVDVWHGSPHRFKRFTTEKIGTGEGAQAFGWGLYFTSQKSIARHYAKALQKQQRSIAGFIRGLSPYETDSLVEQIRKSSIPELLDGLPFGTKKIQNHLIDELGSGGNLEKQIFEDALTSIGVKLKDDSYTYKATLHKGKDPSEYTWLDWDKPVSKSIDDKILDAVISMPKTVSGLRLENRKNIEAGRFKSGQELYGQISGMLGSDKKASIWLKDHGIDGIRYPAGTLSGGGKGTNYVVFDENAVTIEKITDLLGNELGSSELINDIAYKASELINSGVNNIKEFTSKMQDAFPKIWDKIKKHIKALWDIVSNQRGEIAIGEKPTEGMTKERRAEFLKRYAKAPQVKETAEREKPKKQKGVVSYKETIEPITEQDYEQNRAQRGNTKLQFATNLKRIKNEIKSGIDKYLGAISTRLGNINPKLKYKLRKLDSDINKANARDIKAIEPLLKAAKDKMSKDDFADWDYARKNSDTKKINELIEKYDLKSEYEKVRKVLDNIRKDALDVGLEVGEIEEYWPRILKDPKGFLTAIGREEDWPIYSRMLHERAMELEISAAEMSDDTKATIISNMILFGKTGLGGLSATKQRKIKKIPASLNRFYMDADASLVDHIYRMHKGIEARKFFGKIPQKVAEIRKRLNLAEKKLREIDREIEKDPEDPGIIDLKKQRNKYYGNIIQYKTYIEKYAIQRDYTENIGQYVLELIENKEISAKDEKTVNEILNARFHERGSYGIINAYKNMSYIDTMGSPVSALTQIGDLAWSAYEGGLIRTLRNAYRSLRGKSKITKEDVGIERIAQEFADASTLSRAVSFVFKATGLEKIDSIGKESLLNTALEKYQKQAKKNPQELKDKIYDIFEGETDSVIKDLQSGEITDNVKLLVYNRLLDFQPIALSEMPEKYLNAGNGRIFYMLKTFTIKQFDAFRNEAYNKIKNGNRDEKKQGIINLIKLSMFFVLANMGADALKDWLLGRETEWKDRFIDNTLRLCGISKFITWQARTEGLGTAVAKQILPPFKFINALTKDIITAGDEKGLETLSSLPIIGKLAYWHLGRGRSKRKDLWEIRFSKQKRKYKKYHDKLQEVANRNQFMRKHRKQLIKYKKFTKFQGDLNRLTRAINKLKKREQTDIIKKRIERLETQKIERIKRFLAHNK